MKAIKIAVTGSDACVTEKPVITSGMVGLPVEFTFDEAWNGLGKSAVFRAGSRSYPVSCLQSRAIVPWEVLEKPGVGLYVGVIGADEKGIVKIPTVWTLVDTIAPGVQLPDAVAEDPTPSVYDQILAKANKAVETAESVREDADSGAFIGPAGPKGDAGVVEFVIVAELPAVGDTSKMYLLPEADGEEANRFGEYVFVDGAWERIGSAGVEVNLDEYVKATDYASSSKAGVVLAHGMYGVATNAGGLLYLSAANNTEIEQKQNNYKPITPQTMDYAVKSALTTNSFVLTEDEKSAAIRWLGLDTVIEALRARLQALEEQ